MENEQMMDEELSLFNQKRLREADYEADDDDSNARSHLSLKKAKRYVIISKEKDELGEQEDDENWDPDYNPFFDQDTLFWDPRRAYEEATRSPKKTEESVAFNSAEKLLEDEGYPFKKIN